MVKWLRKMYEHLVFQDGSGAMKINCGKIYEYIGMTLDFSVPREVKVTKLPYVEDIVDDFTKQTRDTKTAVTPAAEHHFKIDQDAVLLTEEMCKVFHNFTAKCLFLTKREHGLISRHQLHSVPQGSESQMRTAGRSFST